jgi:hypothetical protein
VADLSCTCDETKGQRFSVHMVQTDMAIPLQPLAVFAVTFKSNAADQCHDSLMTRQHVLFHMKNSIPVLSLSRSSGIANNIPVENLAER